MTNLYKDKLFAPLDTDLHLERIAGGNETEVYCTDDRRYVVKVKSEPEGVLHEALQEVQAMRQAVNAFIEALGTEHSIPNYFIMAKDNKGRIQPVAIQPYYEAASPLRKIDYAALSKRERHHLGQQLLTLMARTIRTYFKTGGMPDIYGRSSASRKERERLNKWYMFPWRLWGFIVERNLLRSNNLMLTPTPQARIILVDYDPIKHGRLYQFVYYNIRLILFVRDYILIRVMMLGGPVP